MLNPDLDKASRIVVADAQPQLIDDTAMGDVPDAVALLAAGALRSTVNNGAVGPALSSGQPGVARYARRRHARLPEEARSSRPSWWPGSP